MRISSTCCFCCWLAFLGLLHQWEIKMIWQNIQSVLHQRTNPQHILWWWLCYKERAASLAYEMLCFHERWFLSSCSSKPGFRSLPLKTLFHFHLCFQTQQQQKQETNSFGVQSNPVIPLHSNIWIQMAPGSNLKISTHGICQEDLILHILTGSIQEVYVPIDQQTNFWLREKSKACFHH